MKKFGKSLILSAAGVLCSAAVFAQAPPGPLTPPPSQASTVEPPAAPPKKPELPPRKSILGAWRINKDESDDGRAKLRRSREADNSNRGNGPYGSGPRMGGPWPGGGPMGGGSRGGQRGNQDSEDESDRLGELVNPPRELKLSRHFDNDPQVYMYDDREHRRIFYTDGRKIEKQKDSRNLEISARWEDKKLITDEKGPHNGKVSRTFEVSADGRQLIETVHIADSKGNHPVNVQYVYDAVDDASLSFTPHGD
jgi:hypothetical protein